MPTMQPANTTFEHSDALAETMSGSLILAVRKLGGSGTAKPRPLCGRRDGNVIPKINARATAALSNGFMILR